MFFRIVEEMNAGGDNASIKSNDSKSKSAKVKNKKSLEFESGMITKQLEEQFNKGEIAVISKPDLKQKTKISKDMKNLQENKKLNKKLKDFGMGEVVQNLVEQKTSTIDRSLGENLSAKSLTKSAAALQNDPKNRKVTTKEIGLYLFISKKV